MRAFTNILAITGIFAMATATFVNSFGAKREVEARHEMTVTVTTTVIPDYCLPTGVPSILPSAPPVSTGVTPVPVPAQSSEVIPVIPTSEAVPAVPSSKGPPPGAPSTTVPGGLVPSGEVTPVPSSGAPPAESSAISSAVSSLSSAISSIKSSMTAPPTSGATSAPVPSSTAAPPAEGAAVGLGNSHSLLALVFAAVMAMAVTA
ncbi:hypothetical protein LTS18_007974 [Coniosporium uncinatum]|uniref:Uncharacterized protein n=1 Tax=Coniosporium uncinatum TaxID=93489 RepID=A0ACC3DNL5_9PEZI|nr:hypothetical protein LTS18_007974 [Coniosporium uncinatum]